MDRLDSKIEFRRAFEESAVQEICFLTELNIDSSYDNLTDQAKLIIPKKIRYVKEDGTEADSITRGSNPLFKTGDEVKISLGYNGQLTQIFKGFISGIRQKFPLQFDLQDEIYQLKKNSVTLSLNNPSLSELLSLILPTGIVYEITAEQNLGKWRINDATPAEVLNELRKKHGIFSFFRDGILYVGLSVVSKLQKDHTFKFFTPQIITAEALNYLDATERKIKVVCKSIDDNNNTLEVKAGDDSGETRTLYFNNYTEADLKATAKRLVNELKYSGYEGNFTAFATPSVNHGDIVELINSEIPEQSGGYIVDRVVTRAGWGIGGRQDIYIKQKVYDLDSEGNQIEITQ